MPRPATSARARTSTSAGWPSSPTRCSRSPSPCWWWGCVPEPVAAAKEDPGALLDLLSDKVPLLIAFFVGCYVIGSYWADHHRFFSRLGAVDRSFIA